MSVSDTLKGLLRNEMNFEGGDKRSIKARPPTIITFSVLIGNLHEGLQTRQNTQCVKKHDTLLMNVKLPFIKAAPIVPQY